MANERCPSCAAVVRAGDPWCTLCWTDLRPAPAPVVGVPAQPAAPALHAVAAPSVDPLSAPLAVLLGEAAAPAPAAVVTWPCVQCGAANSMDLDTCATCTTPFGGRIKRLEDAKAQRRKVLMLGLGAVGAFLLLLGALTFVSTSGQDSGGTTRNAPPGVDFQPIS